MGMEAQPAQGVGGRAVVPVSRHRTPQLAEVSPDLVFPAGADVHLQQGVFRSGAQGGIMGYSLFPAGADGIDLVGGVFPQQGADGVGLPGRAALHHRQIAPAAHQGVPAVLIGPLGLLVLGEEKHPGGVPVQPVDDEKPAFGLAPADVVGGHAVGGAHLLPVAGHAQKSGGLFDHQQPLVLVKDGEGGLCLPAALRADHHQLTRLQRVVVAGDGDPVHLYLAPGEQALDVVAALAPDLLQQKGEQRSGLGDGIGFFLHNFTS